MSLVHVLGIGQSNLANHCGTPAASAAGIVVFRGETHPMTDPIRGGSGVTGSVWPRLADRLSALTRPGPLVLTLVAVERTSVADWAPGGDRFPALDDRYRSGDFDGVTHVVYQQGEKDNRRRTSTDAYAADFRRLHATVTEMTGEIPWIICRSSYWCGVTSASVIQAQNDIVQSIPRAFAGPDLDQLGAEFRRDDTHFNDAGLERFAAALADILTTVPGRDLETENR